MKRTYYTEIDLETLRELFPLAGRFMERQALRIEALRRLKERSQEEDESAQLRKVKAREILTGMVKLEEWR